MASDRILGTPGTVAIKQPCRVAATSALTLSGLQTVDGVALATDDRVLATAQASSVDNGIYVADTSAWNRATDCDGSRDVVAGTLVFVRSGTSNAGYWYAGGTDPIVVGTNALTWARASTTLAVVSAFAQTLLDDADAGAMLTTLGISAFAQTILDDTTAAAVRTTIGAVSSALDYSTITGNTTLAAADFGAGKVREITATAIITLPASAGVSAGQTILLKSMTTGDVTVVRAGADTVDGQTSYRVPSYAVVEVCRSSVAASFTLTRRPDVRVGDVLTGGYTASPEERLLGYGQPISRTTYAGLFAVYGVTHGSTDGATFRVPDIRGRGVFGRDDMGGSAASRITTGSSGAGIAAATLGAVGGSQYTGAHGHTVTDPTHSHGVDGDTITGAAGGFKAWSSGGPNDFSTFAAGTGITIGSTSGGAGDAQNMPPAIILDLYVKT